MKKLTTICAKVSIILNTIGLIESQNIYQYILGALIIVICITYLELTKED